MSLNAKKVSRSVYTFWNVLGDIGGLYGVFVSGCASLISIFAYQKSSNYLASQLYLPNESDAPDPIGSHTKTHLNPDR
jgi:hypothetical protein